MCIGLPEDEDSTAEEENRPREEKNERRTRGMGGLKKEIKVKQKNSSLHILNMLSPISSRT